jgi:hypothetical protein
VVCKSLVAICNRTRAIPSSPNAFELLGYDVLFDSSLRAWMMEANSSPSLSVSCAVDAELKPRLVADTLRLVSRPGEQLPHAALHHQLTAASAAAAPRARGAGGLVDAAAAVMANAQRRGTALRPPPAAVGGWELIAPSAQYDKLCGIAGCGHKRAER